MGSTLHSGHGRLAAGAVLGAITCTLFAIGALTDDPKQPPDPTELGAVEPIPPVSRTLGSTAPTTTTTPPSSSESSTTTTTTTKSESTTTTTTTTTRRTTTTTTTTTTRPPPTTTTTTCSSLICVG